jgi:hypothetical protein
VRAREREKNLYLVLTCWPVILSGRDIDGGGVELAVDGILIPFGGPGIQIAATLHRSTNLDAIPERGGHILHNQQEIDSRDGVCAVEDDVDHKQRLCDVFEVCSSLRVDSIDLTDWLTSVVCSTKSLSISSLC